MVVSCCAFGCKERYVKGGSFTFHSFPKDVQLRKRWEISIRRDNFIPSAYSRVCSKHFTEDCFDKQKFGGTWLKATAVPTVFSFTRPCEKRPAPKKRSVSVPVDETLQHHQPGPSSAPVLLTPKKTRPAKRSFRYVGDFTVEDLASPRKAQKVLAIAKRQSKQQQKRLESLRKKRSRLMKRVANLSTMLDELKKKSLISESAVDMLEISLPGSAAELLKRTQLGSTKQKYPPALRSFALTLHFYSAKAYDFVRKSFNTSLPHPSTLRKWYNVVDGAPGFTRDALTALKLKVDEALNNDKKVLCALIIDEVAIRKHVEWDGHTFCGYVDYGTGIEDDQLPVAKEALTFMLNAINGHWKIPIGYFLINGLGSAERANLIHEALKFVHETGVEVVSLTFDGASSNISSANLLGTNLSAANITTSFKHPITGKDIFVMLDACHMLKLVRNTLASKGSIVDENGGLINWEYVVKLERYQSEQGLLAATKIRTRHIQWHREKMKVKLAAQTLSNSVADALDYLDKDLNHPEFKGCQPTVEFIRRINNLFDMLNSRNLLAKGFKSPLKVKNEKSFFSYFVECENYLLGLRTSTIGGQRIVDSNRKTGFVGFLVCIHSVRGIFNAQIKCDQQLKFLLTYKLSQDHLETFFSAIRSKGGYNNNPTAKQFQGAYKRLLVHHQITSSDVGNCLVLDRTTILHASSGPDIQNHHITNINESNTLRLNGDDLLMYDDVVNVDNDHSYSRLADTRNLTRLSVYISDVVGYIAGFVQRKLTKQITCEECVAAISNDTPMGCSHSQLLNRKNRGGLTIASNDTAALCKIAETSFRFIQTTGKLRTKNVLQHLMAHSMRSVGSDVFTSLTNHIINQDPFENHRTQLIKAVMFEYFKIRLFHVGKSITEDLQKDKTRSINSKLTLFKGH